MKKQPLKVQISFKVWIEIVGVILAVIGIGWGVFTYVRPPKVEEVITVKHGIDVESIETVEQHVAEKVTAGVEKGSEIIQGVTEKTTDLAKKRLTRGKNLVQKYTRSLDKETDEKPEEIEPLIPMENM